MWVSLAKTDGINLETFDYNLKILRLALETEIEQERVIYTEAMDNFYRQNPPREDLIL